MPPRSSQERRFIERHFGRIWPVHLAAFSRLMTHLRAHFAGDLELLIIMAVIGERTRPENWTPDLRTYRQLTSKPGDRHLQYPINLQSVADYSGIPRESVRRKVKLLEQKGWVIRDGNGCLAIGRNAARDLEEATSNSIDYLEALLAAIEEIRGVEAARRADASNQRGATTGAPASRR